MKTLSEYKLRRIATESLINSLRLHLDSIVLYQNGSFPSAFHLSVLSLEEFAKAKWVEHYYYTRLTNEGFPRAGDKFDSEYAQFEQCWLKLLYSHSEKQFAFIGRDIFDYAPSLVSRIEKGELEDQKQQAIYVGLKRDGRSIDTGSRVSVPASKIKADTAKQMISLLNHEFLEVYSHETQNDCYWGIPEMSGIINKEDYSIIFKWPYSTKLKSRR